MKLGAKNENRTNKKSRIRKGTFFFKIDPNRTPKSFRNKD
jgi:hypothetical protein